MKARDIIFSMLFIVVTVEALTNSSFLVFKSSSDLLYFIIVSLAALTMAITSGIDLRGLKERNIKSKISTLFCFTSSLSYILVTVFYMITNRNEIMILSQL